MCNCKSSLFGLPSSSWGRRHPSWVAVICPFLWCGLRGAARMMRGDHLWRSAGCGRSSRSCVSCERPAPRHGCLAGRAPPSPPPPPELGAHLHIGWWAGTQNFPRLSSFTACFFSRVPMYCWFWPTPALPFKVRLIVILRRCPVAYHCQWVVDV